MAIMLGDLHHSFIASVIEKKGGGGGGGGHALHYLYYYPVLHEHSKKGLLCPPSPLWRETLIAIYVRTSIISVDILVSEWEHFK